MLRYDTSNELHFRVAIPKEFVFFTLVSFRCEQKNTKVYFKQKNIAQLVADGEERTYSGHIYALVKIMQVLGRCGKCKNGSQMSKVITEFPASVTGAHSVMSQCLCYSAF